MSAPEREAIERLWLDANAKRAALRLDETMTTDEDVDAYREAIIAAVRAETDAEWRARVEGAKNHNPNDGDELCAAIGNAALDALLTAVARDREGT